MSFTSWIDDRIKVAIEAALTPENLKTISDAVVAAVLPAIEGETQTVIASLGKTVTDSAGNVITTLGQQVNTTAGVISTDMQQIIGAETNAVQQITNAVVAGIKGILPFHL